MSTTFLTCLLIGWLAGTMAGLLGVGGGILVVPTLIYALGRDSLATTEVTQVAVGTSLAAMVFTSLSSTLAHHQRRAVLWPYFLRLAAGILVGGWLGARLALLLPGKSLQTLLGGFTLLLSARMLVQALRSQQAEPAAGSAGPPKPWLGPAGVAIGAVSSFFGIGGGVMTVPLLNWQSVPIRQAIGTSAACGVPIALAGALTFASATPEPPIPGALGYVHLSACLGVALTSVVAARLGAHLAHRVPRRALKMLFALLVAAASARLLV